jgi:excinuclease ABC subunit C
MAAVYRDRLKALTFIQGSQAINAEGLGDADIFALASKNGGVCIQAFFIRGGQNWGHRSFFPVHTAEVSDEEVLMQFLAQFYEEVPPAPLVLCDREPVETLLLAEAFTQRIGRKVRIEVPQRGDRVRLIRQAQRNAIESLDRRQAESSAATKVMAEMVELFGLEGTPARIEVYDNSHIQGTNALGAMIVAGPEGFRKSAYRKFNIKRPETIAGDDFGMMREVFDRRFARAQEEDPERETGEWPDLVLVDGGRGQLNAARRVLEEIGIEDVPMIGVAKGPHHGREGREVFHLMDGREIILPLNHPVLFYMQRLRDEAHRFAIGAHRQKRSKAITVSSLDEVPGIGPARKKALLMHFGTAKAVRNASLDDLQRAPGVSSGVAQTVYDYFHG